MEKKRDRTTVKKERTERKERAVRKEWAVRKERRAAAKGKVESAFSILATESGTYETKLNKMYELRKPWQADNPKHIVSFMPGNIEEVKVAVGDNVKEGEPLLVFRAMKMNNIILAPVGGKIKAINVKVGENIPKNVIMIEIE